MTDPNSHEHMWALYLLNSKGKSGMKCNEEGKRKTTFHVHSGVKYSPVSEILKCMCGDVHVRIQESY